MTSSGVMGNPEPDEQETDVLDGSDREQHGEGAMGSPEPEGAVDLMGGAEPDEPATDVMGGGEPS